MRNDSNENRRAKNANRRQKMSLFFNFHLKLIANDNLKKS